MAAKRSAKKSARRRKGIAYDAFRAFAMSLPGVEEGTSYGTPAFRVRKKLLTRLHQDLENTLVLSVDDEQMDALMGAHPKVFFQTDHYVGYSMVLVRLDLVAPALLEELFEAAWRRNASRKQVAERETRS